MQWTFWFWPTNERNDHSFSQQGVPDRLAVTKQQLRWEDLNRHGLLHLPSRSIVHKKDDRSIIVTTFHPEDDTLFQITSKNWDILGKSHTTSPLHERKLMVAYRKPLNLANRLVTADCRHKKSKQYRKHQDFLFTGTTPTPKSKQTSILDYLKPNTPRDTSSTSLTKLPRWNRADLENQLPSAIFPLESAQKNVPSSSANFAFFINTNEAFNCTTTYQSLPCKANINSKSLNLVYLTLAKCTTNNTWDRRRTPSPRGYMNTFTTSVTTSRMILLVYTSLGLTIKGPRMLESMSLNSSNFFLRATKLWKLH